MPSKLGGGTLDEDTGDLAVTAGWGHLGKADAVMPAKGKLADRSTTENEAQAIDAEAAAREMSPAEVRRLLGDGTLDVFLNETAHWRNIPANVWEYNIGGYQVIKKWLSYREDEILGRALKPEEAREVMNTARRIAAIILLQPQLDENYNKVKAAAFDWPVARTDAKAAIPGDRAGGITGRRVPLLACPAVLLPAALRHCWTSQQWHPARGCPETGSSSWTTAYSLAGRYFIAMPSSQVRKGARPRGKTRWSSSSASWALHP